MRCLEALYKGQYNNKLPIVCSSIQSLTTNTISKNLFAKLCIDLRAGDKISQRELVNKIVFCGYKNTSIVESVGEFAVRGDIIDLSLIHI